MISLATGSPEGCVLVTLMTDDCPPSSLTSHIVKVLQLDPERGQYQRVRQR